MPSELEGAFIRFCKKSEWSGGMPGKAFAAKAKRLCPKGHSRNFYAIDLSVSLGSIEILEAKEMIVSFNCSLLCLCKERFCSFGEGAGE